MNAKTVFAILVCVLTLVLPSVAADFTLDVKSLNVIPSDIGGLKASVACVDGDSSEGCRRLAAVRPVLTFELVDPSEAKSLKNPERPLRELIGEAESTKVEAAEGGEICMRKRVASEALDQYGGRWKVAPFMSPVAGTDRWRHRWAVKPLFAGYKSEAKGVSVIWTTAELRRLGQGSILDAFRGLFD
ncbi:MAG: hypothetical protein ABL955_03400 [Elusimicrobiota bacterium]